MLWTLYIKEKLLIFARSIFYTLEEESRIIYMNLYIQYTIYHILLNIIKPREVT